MRSPCLAFALSAGLLVPCSAEVVGRVRVEGSSSREEAVLAFLDTRPGEEFDETVWLNDLRRLRNLDLFYEVQGEVRRSQGSVEPVVKLRNKFSTIPVLKYKQGGGASLLTAGIYEVDLFGRLLEAGAQYERFNGEPGFVAWFRHPYLLSRRNKFGSEALVHVVELPLVTIKGDEEAFLRNMEKRWNARLQRELSDGVGLGLELSAYRNDFSRDDSTPAKASRNDAFLGAMRVRSGRTLSLTPRLVLGRIQRDGHRVFGHEASVQAELAHRSLGSQFDFAKGVLGAGGGWLPHGRWNVAYQARLGSKTGKDFQHKFYLGGLDTARGFLDRQFRGEHMWSANLEARPTLFERPFWVLQGAVFADLGKTWDARSLGIDGLQEPIFSHGLGVRLILSRVYRATLRVDAARAHAPVRRAGLNVGLQQFF